MLAYQHKTEKSSNLPVAIVAGGAGFLGSALCENLLTQNCKVIAVDNLKTGKTENLRNFEEESNFYFIEADINKDFPALPNKISYIFHLAGVEEYINGLDLSLETLLVNSIGTKNLLELAQKSNAKFLLASTLEIFHAMFSSWSLKKNLGLGEKQNQAFSHHEAKRYAEAITTEYYKKYNLDSRVVRLLDIYGPKMDLEAGTEISRMIKEATTKNHINIYGDGLKSLHPTYISDVVYGLTKAMFAQDSKGKIYTLVNPKPVSVLNIAYELQKQINEKLKIDFIEEKNEIPELEHESEAEIQKTIDDLGWHPKVDYQEGIALTLDSIKNPKEKPVLEKNNPDLPLGADKKTSPFEEEEEIPSEKPKHSRFKIPKLHFPKNKKISFKILALLAVVLIISIFIIIPTFGFVINAKKGLDNFEKTKKLLTEAKLDEASTEISKASSSLIASKSNLEKIGFIADIANQKRRKDEIINFLDIGIKGASSFKHIIAGAESITEIAQNLQGNSDINVREKLNSSRLEIEKGSDEISEIVAVLKNKKLDTSTWPIRFYKKEITELTSSISDLQIFLSKIRTFSTSTPELLGLNGQRDYLLLFQNNMELRPTGGFIGSYGILSLKDGKIIDLKISDVYTADGELKGKIFPPGPITKYMGQPSWYLRDSNYSPDFKVSAEKAEYFLEKETGELVDGVVALDISVVQEILKVIGPIAVPEFKETISAENLYEKAEMYSEKDFFAGSTQKKDFLSVLNEHMLRSLFQSPKSKWLNLIAGFNKSLNEKHVQAFFHDQNISRQLSEFNWDGQIPIFTPANSDCLSLGVTCDYLGIVESNFGANKANAYLKRDLSHEIVFGRSGEVEEKITIKYNNESPSNAWPAGTYKNYLRIYTPQNSSLLRIDLDDKKASMSAHTDTEKPKTKEGELDVEIATESAKTSFGFYIEVPFKSQKTVSVSYRLPYTLSFSKDMTDYKFYWQKQAGTDADPISLKINFPSFYRVGTQEPPAELDSQAVKYSTTLNSNRLFSVEFAK